MSGSDPRHLSCEEVLLSLQSYLDGETGAGNARQMVGHLDLCPDCDHERQIYADIKRALMSCRASIDPDVKAGLLAYGQRLARGEI
ncbi:MAG: zf-HC2 domain-containing protein [Acidimicrobiia bacterium]|nr:zf-HC2 domain-containing protein [Acidimicrobiia bacterium]MDH4363527.1 zf-HC2 domain-containing protein [Acidimicrobiia bacterium]MDH5289345.1 zf-HC2 domain-containing protein [Acidimicrobiia bacterium]